MKILLQLEFRYPVFMTKTGFVFLCSEDSYRYVVFLVDSVGFKADCLPRDLGLWTYRYLPNSYNVGREVFSLSSLKNAKPL